MEKICIKENSIIDADVEAVEKAVADYANKKQKK